MFLADYHIHSVASDDGHDTMADMAAAARERGITQVCFTDHFDLDDYRTGNPCHGLTQKWPDEYAAYEQALKLAPAGMEIRIGMELGEPNHDPEQAREIVALPELDFIIGSVHNLKNTPDFYCLKYTDREQCRKLNVLYLQELIETARLGLFDVMGHICYTSRYMSRAGIDVKITVHEHGDMLKQLFEILISSGKGIEVNCSGLRDEGLCDTFPSRDILALYRQMGGEIITVGSDAHYCRDAGAGIETGYEILRSIGFRYVTVFKDRTPEFIKI